jgi:hypothetical protein
MFGSSFTEHQTHLSYNSAIIKPHRSLYMKKLVALTALTLSIATASAFAESLTGVVADSMCASNKSKAASAAHADCAAKCIKGGSAPVLVVGDKVYKISNPTKIVSFAGHKVTVDGTVANDTITVASVKE